MKSRRCHLKKNDKVKVIAGKDKGKVSKILKVIKKDERVIVENVNMIKRHMRPTATMRQSGIIEKEAPISWSNVMVMCDKCVGPVRTKIKVLEDGKKTRVCSKCGELIEA